MEYHIVEEYRHRIELVRLNEYLNDDQVFGKVVRFHDRSKSKKKMNDEFWKECSQLTFSNFVSINVISSIF